MAMQTDPGENVGSILILIFQALHHTGQMDQVQHPAPVNGMLLLDGIRRILNGLLHQLHLLNPVLHQLPLNL